MRKDDAFEPGSLEPGPVEQEGAASAVTGLAMSRLARMPAAERAASLARMGAGTGAFSISGLLARKTDAEVWAKAEQQDKKDLAASGVKIDLASASEADKLAEIRRLQAEGKHDGAARVWRSMSNLHSVALANRELFEVSLEKDKSLIAGPAFKPMRDKFKEHVEARVLANLQANRDYVRNEMKKLGVGEGDKAPEKSADTDKAVRKLQLDAEQVKKNQAGMAKAMTIPVGYDYESVDGPGGSVKTTKVVATFSPTAPPMKPASGKDPESGAEFRDYKEVKAEYEKLDMGVQMIMARSPAIFAIVGESGTHATKAGKAGELTNASPEEVRAKLKPALEALLGKMDEAAGLVGDDMDYRDFLPVHQQLMASEPWSGKLEKAVIADDVAGHETTKLLTSLGLSAISAIGMLVATFATGGVAIFLGAAAAVAASGTQAGISIEDYFDKAKAYDARSGNPDLDIITKEQVDSAMFQAIMDTALALVDAWSGVGEIMKLSSPAFQLAKAGKAGLRASAETALKEALASGDAATKAAALEKAVAELGTDGAAKAAGKTPEELAKLLPAESQAAKKLASAAEAAKAGAKGSEELIGKLKGIATLDKAVAEQVVREGFERLGYIGTIEHAGGWKSLTKTFGEGHPHVSSLENWRSSLVEEGKAFVTQSSKESSAVRTGTEQGTSDVDISTFGKDAGQNVERIKEFMAKRLNTNRDKLEFLLDADAAVNPSRMHLQDVVKGISKEAHNKILSESAKHQEKLMLARRWHDAVQAGDQELMKQLEDIAKEAGIGDIPKNWKPMGDDIKAGLEKQMDNWAQQLAKLEADNAAEALKQPLIEKIGRAQAEVLANNPNMYMDAGNIKSLVTRRGIDKAKIEAALGALEDTAKMRLDTLFPQERYLKILGEGSHIDHAFKAIKAGKSPQSVADAMKALAKHGERVVQTIGADIAHGVDPKAFEEMAKTFASIMDKAKKGELLPEAIKDMAALQTQATSQASNLQKAMTNSTKALREQAQLGPALTADEAAGIAAWARAEGAARAQTEAIKEALTEMGRHMQAGKVLKAGEWVDLEGAEAQSHAPKKAPNATEEPNQSVAPATVP